MPTTVWIDQDTGLVSITTETPDFSGPVVVVTGFAYTLLHRHTLLKPAGTLATGAITLPVPTYDGQRVTVTSTQEISNLTVNADAGHAVSEPPTFIPAGQGFAMKYSLSDTTWYPAV